MALVTDPTQKYPANDLAIRSGMTSPGRARSSSGTRPPPIAGGRIRPPTQVPKKDSPMAPPRPTIVPTNQQRITGIQAPIPTQSPVTFQDNAQALAPEAAPQSSTAGKGFVGNLFGNIGRGIRNAHQEGIQNIRNIGRGIAAPFQGAPTVGGGGGTYTGADGLPVIGSSSAGASGYNPSGQPYTGNGSGGYAGGSGGGGTVNPGSGYTGDFVGPAPDGFTVGQPGGFVGPQPQGPGEMGPPAPAGYGQQPASGGFRDIRDVGHVDSSAYGNEASFDRNRGREPEAEPFGGARPAPGQSWRDMVAAEAAAQSAPQGVAYDNGPMRSDAIPTGLGNATKPTSSVPLTNIARSNQDAPVLEVTSTPVEPQTPGSGFQAGEGTPSVPETGLTGQTDMAGNPIDLQGGSNNFTPTGQFRTQQEWDNWRRGRAYMLGGGG